MNDNTIMQYKNIYCYGAGDCFNRNYQRINEILRINGVIDSDPNKIGRILFDNVKCLAINEALCDDSFVIITIDSFDATIQIINLLVNAGFKNYTSISDFYLAFLKEFEFDNRRQNNIGEGELIGSKPLQAILKDELTFVVTGRIDYDSAFSIDRCIKSIHECFSGAKIVLSTWDSEDIAPMVKNVDDVVLLKMPDQYYDIYTEKSKLKKRNSVNLQQLAVSEGIKRVNTHYVIRLRSDFIFENDSIISYYLFWNKKLLLRDQRWTVFDDRILSLDPFMYNTRVFNGGNSYTISDCFQMGTKNDMMRLWDGHCEREENLNYHQHKQYNKEDNPYDFAYRYNPEQCLLINAIKNKGLKAHMPEYYYERWNDDVINDYERIVASNIIVGNHQDLGLKSRFMKTFPYYLLEKEDIEDMYKVYLDYHMRGKVQ